MLHPSGGLRGGDAPRDYANPGLVPVRVRSLAAGVRTVEGRRRIRLTVYLDVGSESMSGTVGIEHEQRRPFQGWIELAHAIDRAHATVAAEPGQGRPRRLSLSATGDLAAYARGFAAFIRVRQRPGIATAPPGPCSMACPRSWLASSAPGRRGAEASGEAEAAARSIRRRGRGKIGRANRSNPR
jgi:hypothetical protein